MIHQLRMPGYTAEASLKPASRSYVTAQNYRSAVEGLRIYAQQAARKTKLGYACVGTACACAGFWDCFACGSSGACTGTCNCDDGVCICSG
jgi:hypothetical protein